MLDSLKIQNFKNIQNLEIPVLASVNLITGKNNTGKTSILEALSIWASDMDFRWVFDLLKERGEFFYNEYATASRSIDVLKSFSSFFHKRMVNFDAQNSIFIGNQNMYIQFNLIKFIEEIITDDNDSDIIKSKNRVKVNSFDNYSEVFTGLEILKSNSDIIIPINRLERNYSFERMNLKPYNFQFVRSNLQETDKNAFLWSKIALSDKEDYVIDALKTIEASLDRINFVKDDHTRNENRVLAKVKGLSEILTLKSMGDGINRVLTVILHLVNAANGYCFIDEFENGLHYSVQEKLWEIVFFLSQKLNIQVFATTHSRDCVEGFAEVCNMEKYQNLGKLIHLY